MVGRGGRGRGGGRERRERERRERERRGRERRGRGKGRVSGRICEHLWRCRIGSGMV